MRPTKRFIVKCDEAFCCCNSDDLGDWFWKSEPGPNDYIISFDTHGEADDFVNEYDLAEASEYMDAPPPEIVVADKYMEADKLQLKLFN